VAARRTETCPTEWLVVIPPLAVAGWGNPPEVLARRVEVFFEAVGLSAGSVRAYGSFAALVADAVRSGAESEAVARARLVRPQTSATANAVWRAAERPARYSARDSLGTALQNALFHLSRTQDFEKAVLDTALQGGRSDINGAVCGGLLGATFGANVIPGFWSGGISCPASATAPRRPAEAIERVARALALLGADAESWC
jgi:hypothetical protein